MNIGALRSFFLFTIGVLIPACGIGGDGTLQPTVAPAVPTGLTGIGALLRVVLSWTTSPAASSYTVQRSQTSGGPYLPLPSGTGITTTSFVDHGLTNGTSYYYVISTANPFGQSGNSSEVKVVPGFNAALISAGNYSDSHVSLAVLRDGSLWGWGDNSNQLLVNATPNTLSTVALEISVPSLLPLLAILTSGFHVLALKSDGTVWAWGLNYYGNLGNGSFTTTGTYGISSPAQVSTLTGMTAIAAGGNHSLALKSDGTVWAWGENAFGQIGNGTIQPGPPYGINLPVQVSTLTGVTAIIAGVSHSVAIKSDGSAWAWGYNQFGEYGNGTTTTSLTPTQITSLTSESLISRGCVAIHCLAVVPNHQCVGWGCNTSGQLELAPPGFSPVPIVVTH